MSRRILVVEDNEQNVLLASFILQQHDFDVYTARDGAEAVTTAKQVVPELILMDVMLPGMNGLEAAKHIHQEKSLSKVPIIIVSATLHTVDRKKAMEDGVTAFIEKPYTREKFISVIKKALG